MLGEGERSGQAWPLPGSLGSLGCPSWAGAAVPSRPSPVRRRGCWPPLHGGSRGFCASGSRPPGQLQEGGSRKVLAATLQPLGVSGPPETAEGLTGHQPVPQTRLFANGRISGPVMGTVSHGYHTVAGQG